MWESNDLKGVRVHTDMQRVVKILRITQYPITLVTDTLAHVYSELLFCLFVHSGGSWLDVCGLGRLFNLSMPQYPHLWGGWV